MEIVKEHEGTAGEFYILLLELAYDRLFNTFFSLSFYILFSFGRVSFRICIKFVRDIGTKRNEHGGRNGKYPVCLVEENSRRRGRGSRDSIRHANVSWPLHRQREGNTFRGRNAKVGSSMRLVASLQYFRFNDPLLAILSAGGMDRGHKDDSRILLWGGENRWVISFNLYVSLDDYWQLWEIKGWLMNRFSTDIGWIAIYLDLLSNHLNLERKIFFFYWLQNPFRSTVDRGIRGQVPLGGWAFQRKSELRQSIETNFVSQLIATCLGSDENNAWFDITSYG